MLASELIARALRLINVPGRGGVLSSFDTLQAFETLQEILDSEAVSTFFVPGINRHFFDVTPGEHIYSYGPGADFDTDDFFDPLPIKIEDAYIRAGAAIARNELVTSWDFLVATGWTLGTGWMIANGKASKATGDPSETLDQVLALVPGTAYTLRLNIDHRDGSLKVEINQDGAPIVDQDIIESGEYEFDFIFSGSTSDIVFTSDAGGVTEIDVLDASILEAGKDRVELAGTGSDYTIKIIDQKRYNRRFSKGTGGRPYQILFSRNHPLAEVRFDNAPTAGDILVMDVLVNRTAITEQTDEIRMHPDAIKWLRYEIADHEAGAFGKQLSPRQVKIKDSAWDKLAAGNLRMNTLRVDRAMRSRPTFDINRGDP
jgi:hypothetical protein